MGRAESALYARHRRDEAEGTSAAEYSELNVFTIASTEAPGFLTVTMKVAGFIWLFLGSCSLATSSPQTRQEAADADKDVAHEQTEDLPSRAIELHRRRRGGGGGGDVDFEDEDDDDDDDYKPPPCVESTYVVSDPRSNRFGYGSFTHEGPGSKLPDAPIGGHTRNGSGAAPEWYQESDGSWVHTCDREYDWGGRGYYFAGGQVPYPAGDRSPNGLVPFFFEWPAPDPERAYLLYELGDSPDLCRDAEEDRIEDRVICQLRNSSYCYPYPSRYEYTESIRDDANSEPFEPIYDNTTSSLDVLCCCSEDTPCTCDDTGSAGFAQAIGDVQNFGAYSSDIRLHNTTRACHLNINGTGTLVLNGTVDNGSTKADPSLPEIPGTTHTNVCYPSSAAAIWDCAFYWFLLAITSAVVWLAF